MARPFLTARWTNLCLLSYAVPPTLLQPRLPPGLELDLREGLAFVSLVAFNFLDTRVLGVLWPGHCNFPELNFRYYVRQGDQRGVMFIREFVPQRLTCWVARWLYNEPYQRARLIHSVRETEYTVTAECELHLGGRVHKLGVTGVKPAVLPPADSVEHFFKEHQWGFGGDRRGRLIRYEVQHPHWEIYPVLSHHVDFDFGDVYGPEWGCLRDQRPFSVVLAVGSEVKVFSKGRA